MDASASNGETPEVDIVGALSQEPFDPIAVLNQLLPDGLLMLIIRISGLRVALNNFNNHWL